MLLSRRFHLQKSDLFGPRTIKHSGRAAKRNWCNFLLFYSKMHLGTEIKDKVVVQPTCFSKVGFRLPPQLPSLWNGEKKMLHKYHYKSLPNVQIWQSVLNCFSNQTLKCHPKTLRVLDEHDTRCTTAVAFIPHCHFWDCVVRAIFCTSGGGGPFRVCSK